MYMKQGTTKHIDRDVMQMLHIRCSWKSCKNTAIHGYPFGQDGRELCLLRIEILYSFNAIALWNNIIFNWNYCGEDLASDLGTLNFESTAFAQDIRFCVSFFWLFSVELENSYV